MKIFLLSTDQIVGGVVAGVVVVAVVLLIVIGAIIISGIILNHRYKLVSFCYISKTAGILLCKIHNYRYITNDGCPLSTLMFLLVFILYPHNGWNSYNLHTSLICSSQWTVVVAMHFLLLKISFH